MIPLRSQLSTSAVIEQTTNNATTWIGHLRTEDTEMIGGQTFMCPAEADLESIEVFANTVINAGNVHLTLHPFDTQLNNWGPALVSADTTFNATDNGRWKSFSVKGLHLQKGKSYGFRIASPHTLIGMGEAAGGVDTQPFPSGQEWKFSGTGQTASCYSYFSLAFKIGLRA